MTQISNYYCSAYRKKKDAKYSIRVKRPEQLFHQNTNTPFKVPHNICNVEDVRSSNSVYGLESRKDFENKQNIEKKPLHGQISLESNNSCFEFVCGSCFKSFEASEDLNDHIILYHFNVRSNCLKKHEEKLLKENELKFEHQLETLIKDKEDITDPKMYSSIKDPFFNMPPLLPIQDNLNGRGESLSVKVLPSFKTTFFSNK